MILGRILELLFESEVFDNLFRFFFFLGIFFFVILLELMDSFFFDFLVVIFFFFGEITIFVKKNLLFIFFNCVNSNNILCFIKIC